MTIKTDLPWPVKAAAWGLALGLGAAAAMWAYDMGRSFAGLNRGPSQEQLQSYKERIDKLTIERDQYSAVVNSAESQLNIERSAQKQLAGQIKVLESENARLKEDLAFFDSLLPANTGISGIAIRRIKISLIAPSQLRYQLLIMQGGKGDHEFVGNLQLMVSTVQAGKSAMMIFPEGKSIDLNKFRLTFKHYQRMEGVLPLPEGVSVKTVQVRVLEKGQVRAQQSVNL